MSKTLAPCSPASALQSRTGGGGKPR
jgi:hypothetical protein